MLDKGVETSEAFKSLIAEYLAVPVGQELTHIQKALVNINRPAPNGDPTSKSKDGGDNQLSFIGTRPSKVHIRDVVHLRLQARRNNNNDDNNTTTCTNNREDVIGIFRRLIVANPTPKRGRVQWIEPQVIRRRRAIGMEVGQPNRVAPQAQAVQLLQPPHPDRDRLDDALMLDDLLRLQRPPGRN